MCDVEGKPFKKGEHLGVSQRIPFMAATLLFRFYERYEDSSEGAFDPSNPAQFVDFGGGNTSKLNHLAKYSQATAYGKV